MESSKIIAELKSGDMILYLGIGIFAGGEFEDGSKIPYDSDSMILALNDGRMMAPKLMYEYTRAAMDMEQRVGRKALEQKLFSIFSKEVKNVNVFSLVELIKPKYIIDTNHDATLLKIYANEPHSVILGKARIGAELDRFEIYEYDAAAKTYAKRPKELLDLSNPIIFKPMGCVAPTPTFIVSDADFVDWITEAMGGFALPPSLKEYRKDKSYLLIGVAFDKDTQRMAANELTLSSNGGYLVYEGELTKNGANYIKSHNLEQIRQTPKDFVDALISAAR